jgi:hypothetical protein
MAMENYDDVILEFAVKSCKEREPITVIHKGEARKVCVHMVGIGKENKPVIHVFQFGGYSSKGTLTPETGAWRYLYLNEIDQVASIGTYEWYPIQMLKSETEYKPPAFISKVLMLAGGMR